MHSPISSLTHMKLLASVKTIKIRIKEVSNQQPIVSQTTEHHKETQSSTPRCRSLIRQVSKKSPQPWLTTRCSKWWWQNGPNPWHQSPFKIYTSRETTHWRTSRPTHWYKIRAWMGNSTSRDSCKSICSSPRANPLWPRNSQRNKAFPPYLNKLSSILPIIHFNSNSRWGRPSWPNSRSPMEELRATWWVIRGFLGSTYANAWPVSSKSAKYSRFRTMLWIRWRIQSLQSGHPMVTSRNSRWE